ncbi:MAG: hypothetical protein O4861_09280 [Trichodesmium sp. St16_bin4-tuft]|nr:hypothetical protein [Trichodesmium sp. MAG_R01]MDE5068157.1 hypothetical protein [Trichodesmium sp. St4_bin8_1]MDE5071795.1 hypothetical protein [Trichodesmium sp. St5_bin8]MDE5091669.1 hypothetical protein [Trichodesmium sp. St18_bin3_1_1]MDE5098514.1 hypothetical protein [Trichodesmium sp. St16_bin4-tuft]MDE5103688.1 hypothetical protein [Trichodesmium sp. St19_bin2]
MFQLENNLPQNTSTEKERLLRIDMVWYGCGALHQKYPITPPAYIE